MSRPKRNPAWTRDELLVALNYYFQNRDDYFATGSEGVLQLTSEVSMIAKTLGLTGSETLRNASGVSMKLLNFRSHDPQFDTAGIKRGNRLEKVVWDEYVRRPDELQEVANAIIASSRSGLEQSTDSSEDYEEAKEGRILTRLHRYRERDRKIVQRKKAAFKKQHGRVFCEACGFDFERAYGERGAGFIECHHLMPVSELEPAATTKLSDLALLCANCHRMVHAARPWWTLEQVWESLG